LKNDFELRASSAYWEQVG